MARSSGMGLKRYSTVATHRLHGDLVLQARGAVDVSTIVSVFSLQPDLAEKCLRAIKYRATQPFPDASRLGVSIGLRIQN